MKGPTPGRLCPAVAAADVCCSNAMALAPAGAIVPMTGRPGAQGWLAGVNAARRARREDAVVLPRTSSYLGTLVDDLVTKVGPGGELHALFGPPPPCVCSH